MFVERLKKHSKFLVLGLSARKKPFNYRVVHQLDTFKRLVNDILVNICYLNQKIIVKNTNFHSILLIKIK